VIKGGEGSLRVPHQSVLYNLHYKCSSNKNYGFCLVKIRKYPEVMVQYTLVL